MKNKKLPEKGTPEWHRLEIARKTIRMNPIMVNVIGGMTVDEARQILNEYSIKS
jgi:hypothetical protein